MDEHEDRGTGSGNGTTSTYSDDEFGYLEVFNNVRSIFIVQS